VANTIRINVEDITDHEPTLPEPFELILTVKARSYDVSEFRSTFDGYETFYFEKKMYVPMSEENDSMEQVKLLIKFVSHMLIIEY
jgi:hypothetical protein